MKVLLVILSWIVFFVGLALIYLGLRWVHYNIEIPKSEWRMVLPGYMVVIFGFSIAFLWVEVLKWFKRIKPFNCMMCMTGWICLILAFLFHTPFWFFYVAVGVMVGAIWSAFKMRYL